MHLYVCACVCVCVHVFVCACVYARTTVLIAGTEGISLIKQVLKRQGTAPMFATERITEIGVIVQPDHRALCGGHLVAAVC